MDDANRRQIVPGAMVEVTQRIPHRGCVWAQMTRGRVLSYQQKQTGSWFAHGKGDKLWLDRLAIGKDDGEITTLSLDEYSSVRIVGE